MAGWLFLAGLRDGLCWLDGWRVSWLMGWLCWLMADFGMGWLLAGGRGAGWLRVVVLKVGGRLAGGTSARVYYASTSPYDAF